MSILSSIHGPDDVKRVKKNQLKQLAREIREKLMAVTTKNGGHLASNLGVVELTIALHRVFNSPEDKIIFDVSHQTYVHKLLTGRNDEKFLQLRLTGGYGGFSNPEESKHDAFIAGHAGTALSVALGIAYARDRIGSDKNHVIAVLGDASMSCGMTLEALNNLAYATKRLIVIVNDNEFSIGKSVGAIPLYLNKILRSRLYQVVTVAVKKMLGSGKIGKSIIRHVRNLKRAIKSIILPISYFEYYGLRYFGPIDGHNIAHLEEIFDFCKRADVPVLVHVKTTKGMGFPSAVGSPEEFHGIDPALASDGSNLSESKKMISSGEVFGAELMKLARRDKKIVAVVAAMAYGTGLTALRDNLPDQYIDVGIAEEHAVTFSAALAKSGMRPVCAIYSTFLQRAFDQVLHDVCSQNLPVIFCIDRAGIAARDGTTHHGIFDLSFLRLIPNAVILQPKDAREFVNMFHSAFAWNCPVFIRYQKFYPPATSTGALEFSKFLRIGQSEELVAGERVCLISLGNMLSLAEEISTKLKAIGIGAGIVNAMFAKPLDEEMLKKIAGSYETIVTLEDNVLAGGFGSAILEFFNTQGIRAKVLRIGWPDRFISHGSSADILRAESGISADAAVAKIISASS
ncbi:MAG: 1-deoxy-D-xylulose-5-phosphate synthase [Puniceicoccales bacterium]|jgi:1-deoxy-D-xylulose-5-phosphate synthase|nr:1-deoxy-D-xylulose-5-phosphate synthase [Puniceicoccales bacterium]